MRIKYVFFLIIIMIIGCKNEENANLHLSEPVLDQNYDEIIEIPDIIDPYRIIAAEIASLMDDRLLASQVLMSGIDGNSAIPPHMANLLKTSPVGGIMLFRYNLNVSNDAIRSHMSELTDLITKNPAFRHLFLLTMKADWLTVLTAASRSFRPLLHTGGCFRKRDGIQRLPKLRKTALTQPGNSLTLALT